MDGEEIDLFQRCTRFYSKKEIKAKKEIEKEFMGQETISHGIAW